MPYMLTTCLTTPAIVFFLRYLQSINFDVFKSMLFITVYNVVFLHKQ